MISPTAAPRDNLTYNEVINLIVSPSIELSAGLEIVDPITLVATSDVSDKLIGGNTRRDHYATLHGSCILYLTEQFNFTGDLFRPYVTIKDMETGVSARFNQGAYYLTNPSTPIHGGAVSADGFDVLLALHDPVGDSFHLHAGDNYVTSVQDILASRGMVATIEPTAKTLSETRLWLMDDNVTWLDICNELLVAAGYRALWSDEHGALHSDLYMPPIDRSTEWTYIATTNSTIVAVERFLTSDTFQAPNRWVFVRDNPSGGSTSIGAGVYEYENVSSGPTSSSSVGRVITKVVRLEAASQADLVKQGEAVIERDSDPDAILDLRTGPNPLHWHADVLRYVDNDNLSIPRKYSARSWSLELTTGKMEHVWKALR